MNITKLRFGSGKLNVWIINLIKKILKQFKITFENQKVFVINMQIYNSIMVN